MQQFPECLNILGTLPTTSSTPGAWISFLGYTQTFSKPYPTPRRILDFRGQTTEAAGASNFAWLASRIRPVLQQISQGGEFQLKAKNSGHSAQPRSWNE